MTRSLRMLALASLAPALPACLQEASDPRPPAPVDARDGGHFDPGPRPQTPTPGGSGSGSGTGYGSGADNTPDAAPDAETPDAGDAQTDA